MKNGFTLIELIGAMVILSIIALLTFPIVKDSLNLSVDNLSNEQIASLENVTRIWGAKNSDELDEETPRYVTIEELKRSGVIENKDILDVTDKKNKIKGCVKIYFENNKYNYKYGVYEDVTNCH